jgi:hypothetical protein
MRLVQRGAKIGEIVCDAAGFAGRSGVGEEFNNAFALTYPKNALP